MLAVPRLSDGLPFRQTGGGMRAAEETRSRVLPAGEILREGDRAGLGDRPARRLDEVRGRLDASQLRRLEQRVKERRDARAAFRAGPIMVLATDGHGPQSALDRVRIGGDAGVVEKSLEPLPVPEGVLDGLAERRARQDDLREEPLLDVGDDRTGL